MSESAAAPAASSAAPASTENVAQEASENQAESSEQGNISPAEIKAEKKVQDLKKKYNLKVDGREEEMELDLANDEEVKKYLQKAKGFDKRAKEHATLQSQVDQLIQQLKDAPESVLERLGLDVDDFAQKRLTKKIEQMAKSPEQIQREKDLAELDQLRKDKDQMMKDKESAEQETMLQKSISEIENGIISAMEDSKTLLPKRNKKVIGWIGQALKIAMEKGHSEVTVKDVIPVVERRYKQELQELFDVLPEDALEMMIGNNNLERLRKKRVAKVAPPTSRQVARDTGASSGKKDSNEAKAKPMSYTDFFKR